MFADLTITVPDIPEVPAWAWVVAGVVAWYALVGLALRPFIRTQKKWGFETRELMFGQHESLFPPAFVWVFHPLYIVAFAVCLALCLLSAGAVPPPWKLKGW